MINFKQRELSEMLFSKLKERFSELEMVSIMESPENPNNLLVDVIMPEDEDVEIEIREMASEISADILLDYGYHITVSSASTASDSKRSTT